ncbi:hypothetical protein IWW45_000068 [Coemansia sp. RSA 485]|nr:hypothetical protein IWW45_000068 [Coemansia sp. RSA 485]
MPTQQTAVAVRAPKEDSTSVNAIGPGTPLTLAKRSAKPAKVAKPSTARMAMAGTERATAQTNPSDDQAPKFCSICGFQYADREELWNHIGCCNYLAE